MAKHMQPGMSTAIDPKKLVKHIEAIEKEEAEIRSISASHAKRCGSKRELIAQEKDEAVKNTNVPKAVLNGVLDVREYRRKIDETREELPEDQRDLFDSCIHALGMADDDQDVPSTAQQERAPALVQ